MKNRWLTILGVMSAVAVAAGCATDDGDGGDKGGNGSTGGTSNVQVGYADPDGVLILNQGAPRLENGTVTWIAPDGTVEEDVYGKVNGSAVGNTAQDLWLSGDKIYILSDNTVTPESGEPGDGTLVIVDAETFRKVKSFQFDDLLFPRPEGSKDENEMLPLMTPLENILVFDEHNIYLSDPKALFRLDAATGEMTIVEGSYAFGNQGNTIESIVSTRGLVVIGDRFYCGGGGFWSETKLFEFTKGSDKVGRTLNISGEFISGICRTGDHEIVVGTCGRTGEKKSYLTFVDTETMTQTRKKSINADISADLMNSSGITLAGDYLYFAAGGLTVSRVSLTTWQVEEYIHVQDDVPEARYLTCNVVADPERMLLYVSVSDDLNEARTANGNLLVYDCSGDKPRLVQNIVNKASYPVNIYPMSRFYR